MARQLQGHDSTGRPVIVNSEAQPLAGMMFAGLTPATRPTPTGALPCPYCGHDTLPKPGGGWNCPNCGAENA
ncbi:hypothetical protein [Streptomyces hoynatensis]|uniref:Uncharacterized protein n=1 Tax=Streptomyces hoynatensis TaxID=1141874 RepID=A0A3A9ZBK4_9ACTN|nr:hypothetical protein [Streptomyces hoynatensis]RKN45822.1 hypothetical protein D7294_05080 [Streptomyces hoynatensis]